MIALGILWFLCSIFWLSLAIVYLPTLLEFSPMDEIISAIIGFIFLIILGPIAIVIYLLMLLLVYIVLTTNALTSLFF